MKRRTFLKLLGISIAIPGITIKAINKTKKFKPQWVFHRKYGKYPSTIPSIAELSEAEINTGEDFVKEYMNTFNKHKM